MPLLVNVTLPNAFSYYDEVSTNSESVCGE